MISVVCPVYNEEDHIEQLLEFFARALPHDKELIIVDGGSTDHTVDIVARWQQQFPSIRLMHNPSKYVPFALNLAISLAGGDTIVRLDAHTSYSPDYLEKIMDAFQRSGADIVGGPMRAGGDTPFQQAVSYATTTLFGIGNSSFHFEDYKGYCDSVYLGAWKNTVFTRIGTFDEEMLRNQDDEFHYRANTSGIKIYQDPAIRSLYFPRRTYRALFRQYFEYGLFKPPVLKKVQAGFRIRHIIPAGFVTYLLLLPLGFFYHWFFIFFLAYLAIDIVFTFKNSLPLAAKTHIFLIYPVLHLAYGLGCMAGLKKIL